MAQTVSREVREDDPGREALIRRAEALHLMSAALFRTQGSDLAARIAERFASRARLSLDEPEATSRMFRVYGEMRRSPSRALLLNNALHGALEFFEADFGNIRLRDALTGSLRIVSHRGFGRDFLEYFATGDSDGTACGRAARTNEQVAIIDVLLDGAFAPHREIATASGFRAVQSCPMLDHDGRLIGVLSVHYRKPHVAPPRELRLMDFYADLVGKAVTNAPRRVS